MRSECPAAIPWCSLLSRSPVGWYVRFIDCCLPAEESIGPRSRRRFLVTLLVVVLIRQIVGAEVAVEFVLLAALRQLIVWALNVVVWITIIYAIVSWVNPHAPFAPALGMLLRPLLAPIQRILPPVGGFDLSPLVLLLAVYVLQMVVARI